MVNVLKEITIEESLFSVLKSGFYIAINTKGMEKYNKKNLVIIIPSLFINHSKELLMLVADYILNQETEENIELYELNTDAGYPPINLKLISLNNIPYYLIESRNTIEQKTEDIVKRNIKIKTENDITIPRPKLYVIKGGKSISG